MVEHRSAAVSLLRQLLLRQLLQRSGRKTAQVASQYQPSYASTRCSAVQNSQRSKRGKTHFSDDILHILLQDQHRALAGCWKAQVHNSQ